MATYVVTGGAGFIGSHIQDALLRDGHQVRVIDNFASGKRENVNPGAVLHEVDIRDAAALAPILRGADGVFHLAALARIQPSFERPDEYFDVNAVGTRNVLWAAREAGVRRVVYAASSSAYGSRDERELPVREEYALSPQALHPYGSSKRMGEMLVCDMGELTGGPETAALRFFNVYGPRQTTDADGPYATVIGIFLGKADKGEPLTIVPDGHQRRDFTWVGDIARANIVAMHAGSVGKGEIINIGSGQNHAIWDVARFVLGVGDDVTPDDLLEVGRCVMAPPRKGEVFASLADVSLAKKLLDWSPAMKLPEGIRLTQEWMRGGPMPVMP